MIERLLSNTYFQQRHNGAVLITHTNNADTPMVTQIECRCVFIYFLYIEKEKTQMHTLNDNTYQAILKLVLFEETGFLT